ncbi:hypothetical protein [Anaerotignum sp. MB30-C6]|uniref:hypothetical protein n=1 Tax=Anaerotignum sp. MB30-C6 TaxID=3070814 RepID=UPI0027DE1F62|nr:hypothetical protein [Anaerotignum sp. MB30-C6]WMI80350.1 hypothetical protein RBQ60_10930 [Anaerotignum sp. MB30-C6]
MGTFQTRETKREVEILGRRYLVDFGRDTIAFVLRRVQEEFRKNQEKDRDGLGQTEGFAEMLNEEKALLKEAIGEILGCPQEADAIFAGNDTAVLHRDVYTFLVEEYIQVMRKKSSYDVERIEGYESFD